MEVTLDKRYPVAAASDQAWAVLSDLRATAACMPGAQITEQLDATHFKGTVKSKVGPATMQFNGDIELLGSDAATRTLKMLGKGADKGGSSAQMTLQAQIEADGAASVLIGQATITVNGKLAQFGSRLLVPVSEAMLAQFADNFRAAAAAQPAVAAASGPAATTSSPAQPPTAEKPAAASVPSSTSASAAAGAQASLAGPQLPPRELNALALAWTVVKSWFAGLFGKRT